MKKANYSLIIIQLNYWQLIVKIITNKKCLMNYILILIIW